MNMNGMDKLLSFLVKLQEAKIHYSLEHYRDDKIMVLVSVPGERWEIEIGSDGAIEVERFISSGDIADENVLDELFAKFSD